jgi:hypothetical protein
MDDEPGKHRDQRPFGLPWFSSEAAYDQFLELFENPTSKSY